MGDVPSGSDETLVAGAALSRDGESLASKPAAPAPPGDLPADSDATVITSAPFRPDSSPAPRPEFPALESPGSASDAPTLLSAPLAAAPPSGKGAADAPPNAAVPPDASRRGPSHPPSPPSPRGVSVLLEVGDLLGGRYEILEILGQGGMGAVYKAADREVDRIVALKVIRPEMASNPEILARFKQELLLSSQVTHRNVIRIYDLGEAHGVKFITMEYVEGETLQRLVKQRGKLEVAEAVDIMEQVASGLAAAHREGIIHRDLKPANIMRDRNGRVVVMDFGLARTFSGDGMTQTGMMLGTMEYMSPEQAQGVDVKASSDIFTVGLILYELLAGTTPFQAETAIASLVMRTQQRAAPLVNIDRNIPGALSNIVAKCLEKDPAKRYQSAEHLEADLRAWQNGSGARSIHASAAHLRVERVRQLPWLRIGTASILVLALAAGSAWYVLSRRQAEKIVAHGPVSVLIGDFANHTGDSVLDNTLEPMLGVAMEGASFINVYSRGDARKLAKKLPNPTDVLDEQSARLIAMNQGVNTVITGDISLRGGQYDISAIALDTQSGNVLAKADVTVASKQEILSQLPKLAVPIRTALGDTEPSSLQFQKVSGSFTAASLEAAHQDALGVDEQFAGKFQEAFDSFKKATDYDPHFARAYTGMAAMANNLGRNADAVKYMKLAMDNKDRMTERELYRNQGLFYLTTGDWKKCVEQYTLLVNLYPADRVGQNNLAQCYLQLHNAPKALEAAQHAVEIVPRGAGPRITLAFIEAFAGMFSTSEREARTALDISPKSAQAYLNLAEAQLGQGRIKEATDSYHHLQSLDPIGASTAADGLADLAAYQGFYREAASVLIQGAAADLAAKNTDNAARKYAALANIEELQGHNTEAVAAIAKALIDNQSTHIEFLAARVYVDAGQVAKAQKLATSLSSQSPSEPQAYGRIIAGMIALRRKDTKEAVVQFKDANRLLDSWIGHFDLGVAYLEDGAFQEADSEFQQCIERRGEAVELFDDNVPTFSYSPPAFYYRGLALEAMKSPKFVDSYKEYLSIRGNSTEDPLVAQARRNMGQ